jgi:hypothetical protein
MAASSISQEGAASPVPMHLLLARKTIIDDDANKEGVGITPDK